MEAGIEPANHSDRVHREERDRSRHGGKRWFVLFVDPAEQKDGEPDHRHRQEQVPGDDPRVEVGEDRHPAEHRLQGDAEGEQRGDDT